MANLKSGNCKFESDVERLRFLLQLACDSTWEWNVDEDIFKCSELGLSEKAMDGCRTAIWERCLAKKDREAFNEAADKHLKGETEFIDLIIQAAGGQCQRSLRVKGQSFGRDAGGPALLMGVFEDVTDKLRGAQLAEEVSFRQTLIDAMPFPFSYQDRDGKYMGCNMAFEHIVGLGKEEFIGKTPFDIFPAQEAEQYDDDERNILSGGGMRSFEDSLELSSGESCHYLIVKAAFYNATDMLPAGVISSYMDITKKSEATERLQTEGKDLEGKILEATKELSEANRHLNEQILLRAGVEESLRLSEKRFRTIAEVSPVALFISRFKDGRILFCNPQAVDLFGADESMISGISSFDFLDDASENKVILRKLARDSCVRQFEKRLRKLDGGSFVGSISLQRGIYMDEDAIFSSIVDITDLKIIEKNLARTIKEYQKEILAKKAVEVALRESEKQYRILMDTVQVGIWRLTDDGCIMFMNTKMRELLGIDSFEETRGLCYKSFFSDEALSLARRERAKQAAGFFSNYETRLVGKDGKERNIIVSGLALFSETRPFPDYIETFTDITERKIAEGNAEFHRKQLIQADKMASLGILVAGVAHEINNPTNFIGLNTPMLRDAWRSVEPIIEEYYKNNGDFSLGGLPYSEMQEMVPALFDGLSDGAKRIKNIVSGLKDYARHDNFSDMNEASDLNKVLSASLTLLANMIKRSTKKMEIKYNKDAPKVKGNGQRIEQVLINVIQNACQALPSVDCGVAVSIIDRGNRVVIEVADEGVGIPEENIKNIFDPFFTTKRDIGGTGLGLSISAGIIKDFGGELNVESQEGKGTVVSICLPAQLEDNKRIDAVSRY